MTVNPRKHIDLFIRTIDFLVLLGIGLLSVGYIVGWSSFAETHIQLSYFEFPIFIGEMVLFGCFCLFLVKCCLTKPKLEKWQFLICGYFIFVLTKAFYGYWTLGPLALRNAALLYYPFAAILGYYHFHKGFFNGWVNVLLFLVIALGIGANLFNLYWTLTSVLLCLIFVHTCSHKALKIAMLLMLLLLTPYRHFFKTSRMMMISNYFSICFIVVMLISFIRGRILVKVITVTLFFFVCTFIMYKTTPSGIKSLIDFSAYAELIHRYNTTIDQKRYNYQAKRLNSVKLYHPNVREMSISLEQANELDKTDKDLLYIVDVRNDSEVPDWSKSVDIVATEKAVKNEEGRDVMAQIHTAIFRIFIWQDMFEDLLAAKPILGFNLGKPLRSKRLEILDWGTGEWSRDGWIGAHNSYLDIIYRAGIVGGFFITSVLAVLFKMIKAFVLRKSIVGILLCGILINWLMAANFLLILELPYTAIPVWCLFGMVFAYYQESEKAISEFQNRMEEGYIT